MATILDTPEEFNEDSLQENEELTTFEGQEPVEDNLEQEEVVQAEELQEKDSLPDKYKGKSVAEIVQMHQEAEKLVGRQSSEVGELRRVVDHFIKTNLDNNTHEKQVEIEEIDFFERPKEAIAQSISSNSDIQEIKQMKKEMQQREALNKLEQAHPNFMETARSEAFIEWVKASKVRTELLQRADSNFDFDAANELLSTWKERTQASTKAQEVVEKDRGQQRKAASSGSAKGTGESKSKKIYRRSDIINLMQTNPARYLELSDEITQAYSEGRVR
jgi:hypothetical protein